MAKRSVEAIAIPRAFIVKMVRFACVRNAGRSQMAAAFLNQLADPAQASVLVGAQRCGGRLHPEAVAVMPEEALTLT